MKTKFEWKLKKNQLMLTLLVGILLIVIAMPVKKTKTKVTIEERFGLPFFFHKYRKRKMFFCGAVL